jgi:4-amino-4-deoxy-L-arabinose transferase-like glycosyltransferase
LALILRVLYITIARSYRFSIFEDHFTFGYEMGRIARALATGYGYANPFNGHTGPTAWIPPLYPLLLAAVFKLCGVYSALSGWVILSLNSVFSAATAVFLYFIADRCYNRRIALWSAWIWALYPAAMQYAVRWVWEISLTCMLFTAVLALAVKMRGIGSLPGTTSQQTTKNWLLFGLLWALIGLANSTLLLFLPVCGVWILYGSPTRAVFLRALASGLVFVAVISPWMIRNYRVFHTFVPFRSNFGAELYVGDGPGAEGFRYGVLIGPARDKQFQLYTHMGEVAYTRYRGKLATAWILDHPVHFYAISLKRLYFFWVGVPHPSMRHPSRDYVRLGTFCFASITGLLGLLLALRRRIPAAGLFAWAFALLPLTYYFVTVEARFRHPLEPLMVILSVYLFQSAQPRRKPAL